MCYGSFSEAKKTGDFEGTPLSLKCGHEFCRACWRDFLSQRIKEGSTESLVTPCQQEGCNMKVPHSIVVQLFSERQTIDDSLQLNRYLRWHCKSFTDDNRSVKWCPYTKDCNYAVQIINQ